MNNLLTNNEHAQLIESLETITPANPINIAPRETIKIDCNMILRYLSDHCAMNII